MDNIKKAIEEAKCTVALDENDEMVTLDEPRYYFKKDGLFTFLEMMHTVAFKDGAIVAYKDVSDGSNVSINYAAKNDWQQTLKALKE